MKSFQQESQLSESRDAWTVARELESGDFIWITHICLLVGLVSLRVALWNVERSQGTATNSR